METLANSPVAAEQLVLTVPRRDQVHCPPSVCSLQVDVPSKHEKLQLYILAIDTIPSLIFLRLTHPFIAYFNMFAASCFIEP